MGREDGAQCPARCDPRPPLQAQGGPPNVCVPQVPPREPRPACRAEPQPLGPRPALSSWGSEHLCGAGGGAQGNPQGPFAVGSLWVAPGSPRRVGPPPPRRGPPPRSVFPSPGARGRSCLHTRRGWEGLGPGAHSAAWHPLPRDPGLPEHGGPWPLGGAGFRSPPSDSPACLPGQRGPWWTWSMA